MNYEWVGYIMKTYTINQQTLYFDAENHRYYIQGNRIPSVGDIVAMMMPSKKLRIEPSRLQNAAEKGQALKARIFAYETEGIKSRDVELQGYIALKRQHQFEVKATNVPLFLYHFGQVVAAGHLSMLITSPYLKGNVLVDIKRRQHLDIARLTLQLNLYKLAYEQTYKTKIHTIKCLHIRNHLHHAIDIPLDRNGAEKALKYSVEHFPFDPSFWI